MTLCKASTKVREGGQRQAGIDERECKREDMQKEFRELGGKQM